MKICPNCGAENEDNALTCILCEFEFDVDESENYGNENSTKHDELEQECFVDINEDSARGNSSHFKRSESVTSNDESYEQAEPIHSIDESKEQSKQSVPVQEAELPEFTPPPAPPVNHLQNQGYVIEKRKFNPLLIVIVIILALIIGILCIAIFLVSRNDKYDDSNRSSTVSDIAETTTEITETSTNLVTQTTTATTPVVSTTQTTNSNVSADELDSAAKQAVNNFMKNNTAESPKYSLYDVNCDDVPELFISYMGMAGNTEYIMYYFDSSEFKEFATFWGGLDICPDSHYLKETNYGGAEVYKYYELTEENQLNKFDEIYSSPNGEYYRNGQSISNTEYYATIYYYDDMNWTDIYDNSRAFSDLIDMSAYNQNNTVSSDPYADIKQEIINSVDNEEYRGKNSHIENAPSDMRFYNMSERYNMNVSSPDIYTGPSNDYSKIDVYSDFFWVYGENSDWYYVQWSEGNGAFSHSCYGYMSKSSSNSGSKYTEFDTSAAGSDFEFYSGYFVGCRVTTQSGNLNLRAAPSTTAEVIIQMPKDAYVQVLGNNADWDYVSYTDNGTTYYGYASREFISVP